MKTFRLGTTHEVAIYDEQEVKAIHISDYNALYEFTSIKSYFGDSKFKIIGMINLGYPMIMDNAGGILTLDPLELTKPLILIANSLNQLIEIATILELAWQDYQEHMLMVKNEVTKQLRTDALLAIEKVDSTCDLSYWDWLAFLELTITMS